MDIPVLLCSGFYGVTVKMLAISVVNLILSIFGITVSSIFILFWCGRYFCSRVIFAPRSRGFIFSATGPGNRRVVSVYFLTLLLLFFFFPLLIHLLVIIISVLIHPFIVSFWLGKISVFCIFCDGFLHCHSQIGQHCSVMGSCHHSVIVFERDHGFLLPIYDGSSNYQSVMALLTTIL